MASDTFTHGNVKYYLLFLIASSFFGAGVLLAEARILPAVVLAISGMTGIGLIIKHYDGTNAAISYFFDSLKNDDTTMQFQTGLKNTSLNNLYESMNRLNRHFQEIKLQSEFKEKYYRTLIRHSATGLLVLTADNEIELINEIACKYAGISPEATQFRILKIKNPTFYKAICSISPGENIIYKNVVNNNFQLLFFRATHIRKKDLSVKLVSIEDIRQELETKELESYRKLISVLTHEIMNLLSPVTSVSKALYALYYRGNKPKSPEEIDENIIKTTVSGLLVIEEQSKGMLNFVNNYRKIAKIPQPEMKEFSVQEWIEQLKIVYTEKLASDNISFNIMVEKSIKQIVADKKLINQVIINLINNAVEALMAKVGERKIEIIILNNRQNRVLIKISNNGPCIPPEIQEKIFVPFFTTKKNGSGIGLSISQEIMKLHKGSLMVVSVPDNDTIFVIEI